MKGDRYNLVVIGGGSAGLVSAYIGAAIRARVALIERGRMGGECLNSGCVPSKALIRTARFVADLKRHRELGVRSLQYDLDFADVMARVRAKIARIAPHDSVERYTELGVECVAGEAEIVDPTTVRVAGRLLKTRHIILALGASPIILPLAHVDSSDVVTSETIWDLKDLPRRLVVIGGGPVGCEMAQAFARLGSEVTLIEAAAQLLTKEDGDVAGAVAQSLERDGVRVWTGTKVKEGLKAEGASFLVCEHKTGERRVAFDKILMAVGRRPNTRGIDWSRLGIKLRADGALVVDERLRTTCKNIYACGDVIGRHQLTHAAAHQAWYCAVNALFSPFKSFKLDERVLPWAVFTEPELARVGLSEKEARARGIPYEVTRYGVDDLDRAICDSEDQGFVKVLTRPGKDEILGAAIVSHGASEMIGEFVAAMKNGFGLNRILGTIHPYPTFMEANKYAAGAWKKSHAPAWALRFLTAFHSWRR